MMSREAFETGARPSSHK